MYLSLNFSAARVLPLLVVTHCSCASCIPANAVPFVSPRTGRNTQRKRKVLEIGENLKVLMSDERMAILTREIDEWAAQKAKEDSMEVRTAAAQCARSGVVVVPCIGVGLPRPLLSWRAATAYVRKCAVIG